MIDCDVHNDWSTAEVLLPYLDDYFRDFLIRGEKPGPRGTFPRAQRAWLHPEGFRRQDINPVTQDDHYNLMKEHLLDKYDIDVAILTGDETLDISTIANRYYGNALASAYNNWVIDEWLSRDRRLKGSIVIYSPDPENAAAEIRRVGEHPDMVQIIMSSGSIRPYGDPFYHPIWEAASQMNLPIAVHLGGQAGINTQTFSSGPPTFYWEAHALLCQAGMSHVASTIAHGVFEKWPNTYLILTECGVSWFPTVLWRLDNDYRALRKETPWLKRLPSEYARDHIRLTTQPLENPDNKQHLWNVLETFDAKHTLLFSSDYPHWDFDDPTKIPIPADWRENILDANARQVYSRLPARDSKSHS
ncbi:amidohydrolase family protein [Plectonema radiosum NIES-515]|uniref:Amidohydrolase family protein n=1 Tax=Plectonema radiosum NIES-515 TaxID=2986073 RepID=A0ABT3B6F7_9CYAN|nr:amidohydrolase family protein [Plectonema radiosum]MCV3216968.1 amidohydrolase family protein [Plectonema radiosum NIES-515]